MYDVGLEVKFLDRVDAGAVAVLEPQIARRGRRGVPAGSAVTAYSPLFSVAVTPSSLTRSEKGSGCVSASSFGDELERLFLLIERNVSAASS